MARVDLLAHTCLKLPTHAQTYLSMPSCLHRSCACGYFLRIALLLASVYVRCCMLAHGPTYRLACRLILWLIEKNCQIWSTYLSHICQIFVHWHECLIFCICVPAWLCLRVESAFACMFDISFDSHLLVAMELLSFSLWILGVNLYAHVALYNGGSRKTKCLGNLVTYTCQNSNTGSKKFDKETRINWWLLSHSL